jgi:hypothetical protein
MINEVYLVKFLAQIYNLCVTDISTLADVKQVCTLILTFVFIFQLTFGGMAFVEYMAPFPVYAQGSNGFAELYVEPSKLAIDDVATITVICPPSSVSPTTGNSVRLAHSPYDAAFAEVITPLEVELTETNPGHFDNAKYIWTWHRFEGFALPDGRVRFEVQYPIGESGFETHQWQPANHDFPIGEAFPGTMEGQYQVTAQCFYGLGTTDGHALSAPAEQFAVSAQSSERIVLTSLEVVNDEGMKLSHLIVGSKVVVQSSVTNTQEKKQPFIYIVQIKDKHGFTVSLSWLKDEPAAKELNKVSQSWVPEKAGYYRIEVFLWDSLDKPTPLSPALKRAVICYPSII